MPYRCAGVSIRTALLFSLLGRAAPCWLAAAGSAFRLKGAPCGTSSVYGDQKHARMGHFQSIGTLVSITCEAGNIPG